MSSTEWFDYISLSKEMKFFPSLRLQSISSGTTKDSLLQALAVIREANGNHLQTALEDLIQLGYADTRIAYQ